jgi:NADH:ubiquinone oxidoreductase subunit 6 (subunit J)
MQCPSCKSEATTLLRSAVSLQGVSFAESVKGLFKCQHCGALLRITSYGKRFWIFYIPAVAVLFLFALLYLMVSPRFSNQWETVWAVFVLLIFAIYAMGSWKYCDVEVIRGQNESKDIPSV